MSRDQDPRLLALADRIGERAGMDWQKEFLQSSDARELGILQSLQTLSRIGELHASAVLDERHFGRLELREEIGRGSFGRVYRAHDPQLQRDVALKLLDPERTAAGEQRERILSEARCLAALRHENVVTVHGVEEHSGRIGFWMELVEGRTLADIQRQDGNLSEGELRHVARTLAGAIAALHRAGVLHRDIKPHNVLRERGGRLVLMDLGAGSQLGTTPGTTIGTPLYLAPELLHGGEASRASDLYALGVTLFHLASGRHPYEAASLDELRSKQARGERLRLADLRPELSPEFVRAIERCLEGEANARWSSAGELAGALGATSARRARALSRRRMLWASVAVVVLASLSAWSVAQLFGRGESFAVQAAVYRYTAAGREELDPGAFLRPDDAIGLRLQSPRALHVYVLNRDQAGNTRLLFPLPGLDLANPLPAGAEHHLPGAIDGELTAWGMSEQGGDEELLVIAAAKPAPELERLLAELPAAAPGEPRELGAQSERVLRGLGRLVSVPDRPAAPDQGPWAAIDLLLSGEQEARGMWVRRFQYRSGG